MVTFDFETKGSVIAVVTTKTGLSISLLMVFSCEKEPFDLCVSVYHNSIYLSREVIVVDVIK